MRRVSRFLIWLILIAAAMPPAVSSQTSPDLLRTDFAAIENMARGSTVRFYMYGGWAHVNEWIDTYVAGELKKRYDITLNRVPMDAAVFMNKLFNEKAAGKKQGSIDLLWINGENFKNAREGKLLFGPFTDKLPNFRQFVDPITVEYDFGYPVGGFEAPYGRAQFVFEYDTKRTPHPPGSYAALKQWVRDNPGRFTYPQPPDFTGSAFIRQVFYAATGGHGQYLSGFDRDLFNRQSPKLWAWLNDLEPFLWQKGRSFPKDSASQDTLFGRGEVDMCMSYHPSHAQSKILEGSYPETVRTLVMAEGSIYNTHFTAIPANARNKARAMVAANFLMSPEAQFSKFDPANWGDFPAIDLNRVTEEWRQKFANTDLGEATLSPEELTVKAVPEIPAAYLEALEEGWEKTRVKVVSVHEWPFSPISSSDQKIYSSKYVKYSCG